MPSPALTPLRLRALAELGFLLAFGAFMGVVGPYGSSSMAPLRRYTYWGLCIVGGGLIGIALDEVVKRRVGGFWPRLASTSTLMTPAVALLVLAVGATMVPDFTRRIEVTGFLWQVWVICLAVMAGRALLWRQPRVAVVTRTVVEPPLPEAEARFRRRLSARRRSARLIAVQAEDHYLRVHTDAGSELLALRMADAMDDLAGAHGYRIHRSWWVAADAIRTVAWRKGGGEARLAGDITAPVSRSNVKTLKDAGWF